MLVSRRKPCIRIVCARCRISALHREIASRPGVTAPIVGPRTLAQFEASLAALEIELGEDAAAELDGLFPGPGGPAPEAYAW